MKLLEKEQGNQTDQEKTDAEFVDRAIDQNELHLFCISGDPVNSLLGDIAAIAGGRVNALVLSASEGVHETADRARVTPVQGRIGHRGERHVKVEGRAR